MNPQQITAGKRISILQRFRLAYQIDPKKYEKKGKWLYVGYVLLMSYFTVLPKVLQQILSWMLERIPQKLIGAVGMIIFNLIITIFYNLVMVVIYRIKHPFFQRFRVNQSPWQWQTNPQQWNQLLKKSILFFFINNIVIGVPLAYVDSLDSKYRTALDQVPDLKTILWQFALFLLVEDCLFYWFHRLFHHPLLYRIHKYHHEYKNTITIAAQSAHPLEGISGSTLPLFLGFKVLSQFTHVHVISIWVFFIFRVIEGYDSHSGYEWGWAQAELIPFNSGSAYHSFHHSHNVGNFGSFFKFWDTLCGTNQEYIKYRMKLDNQQVEKVKEK